MTRPSPRLGLAEPTAMATLDLNRLIPVGMAQILNSVRELFLWLYVRGYSKLAVIRVRRV